MGVRKVCSEGYILAQCRCNQKHTIKVEPCEHENHEGKRMASVGDLERVGIKS